MRRQGITRRGFLKFCTLTTASLGLGPSLRAADRPCDGDQAAHPGDLAARLGMHLLLGVVHPLGAHPLASDVILSMISLDYDDTDHGRRRPRRPRRSSTKVIEPAQRQLHPRRRGQPAAGPGRHVSASSPANPSWKSCKDDGRRHCQGGHRLGLLRLLGLRPGGPIRTRPGRRRSTRSSRDKPVIKVPGCPPIAEVMTGVITYMLTFDRFPELDRQGRPVMFYGQRIHDKCYRRPHFDAGQFVEAFDDDNSARKGYCLYKIGCKGPTTYNACSTVRWNNGVSFPIQSGHGCIGCSEDGFWDKAASTTVSPTPRFRHRGQCGQGRHGRRGASVAPRRPCRLQRRSKQSIDAKTQGVRINRLPGHQPRRQDQLTSHDHNPQRLRSTMRHSASSSTRSPGSKATCAAR
jgi:hydrogenase small subunit